MKRYDKNKLKFLWIFLIIVLLHHTINLDQEKRSKYSLEATMKGFNMILSGDLDDLPEQAFYLVGDIDEAIQKAESLKAE